MDKSRAKVTDIYRVGDNAPCNPKLRGEPFVIDRICDWGAVGVVLVKKHNPFTKEDELFEAPLRINWEDLDEYGDDFTGLITI